ncbi:hypothetical protein GCM10010462_17690 [Microbacterium dextranolyticum]|uniref:Uncharacterized protein n=1 Tax=Microbacterium dextranolyticum TaxID=36806 RepID=A0A9W6HMS6_9MICO|nr:hypothetical protein GCM10017591_13360 [Microbacterium dextranolyticum]
MGADIRVGMDMGGVGCCRRNTIVDTERIPYIEDGRSDPAGRSNELPRNAGNVEFFERQSPPRGRKSNNSPEWSGRNDQAV